MSGNPLKDTILGIIGSEITKSKTAMLAEVINYDRNAATIDIKPIGMKAISSSNGLVVEETMKKISVLNSVTFKDQVPEIGDRVYMDFIGGDFSKGIVLNILKGVTSDTYQTGSDEQKPDNTQAAVTDLTNIYNLGGGII